MGDLIHIEQFLNIEQNKSETERLEKEVAQWMRLNMANTAIQLSDPELIMGMMEVHEAFLEKDYSSYLNKTAQKFLDHYKTNEKIYTEIANRLKSVSLKISSNGRT